jgi:cytochrome c biogenesis factor
MKALLAKPFVEVGEVLANIWGTLKLLAGSRKAILTAIAAVLALAVTAMPELAQYQEVVYNRVDVLLGILVILIGLIDAIEANRKEAGTAG